MRYEEFAPLFGHHCFAVTARASFVGTLHPIPGSKSAVSMTKLPHGLAAEIGSAVNGVTALNVDEITLCDRISNRKDDDESE